MTALKSKRSAPITTHVFRITRLLPTGHPVIKYLGEFAKGVPLHAFDYTVQYIDHTVPVNFDTLTNEAKAAVRLTAKGAPVQEGIQQIRSIRRRCDKGYASALQAAKGCYL